MISKVSNFPIYMYKKRNTSSIMLMVCLATFPGIMIQLWFFGWSILLQIFLGCTSAIIVEAIILTLRKMKVFSTLCDFSAFLTGLLLSISIPPFSPWWIVIIGSAFSIIFAKQIYGGLGNNLFNPAMIGYVTLLISFPVQMTNWLPCREIFITTPNFIDTIDIIFSRNFFTKNDIIPLSIGIDSFSQATPLFFSKKPLCINSNIPLSLESSRYHDIIATGNTYWKWINIAYFLGGIFLLYKKIIHWHIPVFFLSTVTFFSFIGWIAWPQFFASPKIHLLSGATMLGAFFILTDPVTSSTTKHGRFVFGILTGMLVWIIRSFGDYLDGIAFATLIANSTVPLIDHYTRPKTYGH